MQRRLILFFQILLLLTILLNTHAAPTRIFEDQFNGNQGWAFVAPAYEVTFNNRLSVKNITASHEGPHIFRGLDPQLQTTLSNNGYWRLTSRFRYTDLTGYGTDALSIGTANETDPRGPNTYNILGTHANLSRFSISGMNHWGGASWELPTSQALNWWEVTLTVTGNNWHFQFRNETTGDIYQRSGTASTMPVPRSIIFGQRIVQPDNAGNYSPFENDYIIIELDTDRPTISHTLSGTQSISDPAFYRSPVTIGFNASDNCLGCINSGIRWIEYQVNSSPTQQINNSSTTTNITAQGIHTFQYRTRDNAGNLSNWSVGGFAIDSLPPTTAININGTLSGSWYTTRPTITLNATDPNPTHHSGVGSTAYRINGASSQIYTAPFLIQNDGLYIIRYSSIDRAGNVEIEKNQTITVDTTPPTIDVNYTDADLNDLGNWRRGIVTAHVNAQDAVSGIDTIEYRINSGGWTTYSGNMTFSGNGQQTIQWRVRDQAGHVTSRTDTIRIDNTSPQTQASVVNASPINGWYAVAPQISLSAIDTQSGVEQTTYEINGGITQTYSGQFSLPTSGEYTLTYRSRDLVGNVEADQTLQLSIDIDPPLSTHAYSGILGLNNWYVGTGELSFSAIDAHSGVEQIEYQLDSGAWEVYSQPLDLIADGVHQIRHRATDYAGHVETQRTATIQIDTLAPETTLSTNQPSVNGWYPADVELTLDAVDTGSGVFQTFYSLDGNSLQVYHTPVSVNGDGIYRFEFTSVDDAGNTEPPQLLQFGIDTIAPTTTALYNSSLLSPDWYTEDVTVVFQGHDDGAGIAYIEYTLNGSGWQRYSNPFTLSANGEHEINYRSVDRVGHIGAIQSDIVRIDQTNPELSIHVNGTRGSEGWFVSPVTMRLDFRDPVSGIERTEYEIGAGWQTYQTPIRLTTEGQTRINASTYDRAGNYRVADTLVKIDTLPPTMTQVSCPERAPMGDLIIQTNANDLSSGIVRWEVMRVNEHGHTWTFSGAGDGRRLPVRIEDGNFFTFQSIKLIDRAGHIFVSSLDCYVVLDLQAPEPIVPTEQPTVRPTQTPFPTMTLTPTPTSTPTATRFIQFVTNTPRPITTVIAGSPTPTTTRIFGAIPTLIPLVDRMMTRIAPLNTRSAIDLESATLTPTPTPTLRSGQPLAPIQTAISFFDRVLTQIAPTITPTPTSTHTPTATATATNTLTPTSTITRTPAPTATPTQFVAMGELPSGGGTNSNSQDDNLSLEQALLAALLATGTASVVGAKVAETKEKRRQAVKADNQSNDKANQQKIAQAEKVKQDDQAYAKRMVEQLQQHGQFWLSAALVSVLGIGVCAYLLSNPQYDHLPIAYDCDSVITTIYRPVEVDNPSTLPISLMLSPLGLLVVFISTSKHSRRYIRIITSLLVVFVALTGCNLENVPPTPTPNPTRYFVPMPTSAPMIVITQEAPNEPPVMVTPYCVSFHIEPANDGEYNYWFVPQIHWGGDKISRLQWQVSRVDGDSVNGNPSEIGQRNIESVHYTFPGSGEYRVTLQPLGLDGMPFHAEFGLNITINRPLDVIAVGTVLPPTLLPSGTPPATVTLTATPTATVTSTPTMTPTAMPTIASNEDIRGEYSNYCVISLDTPRDGFSDVGLTQPQISFPANTPLYVIERASQGNLTVRVAVPFGDPNMTYWINSADVESIGAIDCDRVPYNNYTMSIPCTVGYSIFGCQYGTGDRIIPVQIGTGHVKTPHSAIDVNPTGPSVPYGDWPESEMWQGITRIYAPVGGAILIHAPLDRTCTGCLELKIRIEGICYYFKHLIPVSELTSGMSVERGQYLGDVIAGRHDPIRTVGTGGQAHLHVDLYNCDTNFIQTSTSQSNPHIETIILASE